MMSDLISILHEGHHSLVVANGDVCTFDGRGISDLYFLLSEDPGFLRGASVADKVVGKGAAALMILGGVVEVYADIISSAALRLLKDEGLRVHFGREVTYIINRNGDGTCPVEQICLPCNSAAECLPLIKGFMENRGGVYNSISD